jgi:hypothetical protein
MGYYFLGSRHSKSLQTYYLIKIGKVLTVKVQIIHAGDFIKTTPEGEVSLKLSKTRLAKIVQALEPAHDNNFLVDWRNVTINFSMTHLFYLALEITKYEALSGARISLLVKPDDFDRGDFLQICAQNRGVQLSAFTEYENAMNWLTTENEIDLQEIS